MFVSFRFYPIPKLENSEISESALLLQILTVIVTFFKFVFSIERTRPYFFRLLILRYVFAENFIKVPRVVQKIWRFSCSILVFSAIFRVFWHFLVTKKLMKSAYNRLCWHFFYFQPNLNRLFNSYIKWR